MPSAQRISQEIVLARVAHSSALIDSSPWRAEQHDVVAHHDLVVAHVHDDLVHRDHAREGVATTTDENCCVGVEEPARETVGVTEGNRHDVRVTFERATTTITRTFARLHSSGRDDLRAQRERGRQRDPVFDEDVAEPGGGQVPVERQSHAREVSARLGITQCAPALLARCTTRGRRAGASSPSTVSKASI